MKTQHQNKGSTIQGAILLLAAATAGLPAAAAPSGASLFASGGTMPAAIVRAGASLWVSDHTMGFCRIAGSAIDQNSCVVGGAVAPGQAIFRPAPSSDDPDAGVFYVPDLSSKSLGVYQYAYQNGQVSAVSVLAPNAGLGGNRPVAVAWGPDDALYVAFVKNNSIVRIRPATGRVEAVGTALARNPQSIAFADATLYLAEATGMTQIARASACLGGCRAAALQGLGVPAPVYVTSNGAALFVADLTSFYRHTLADRCTTRMASGFANLSALGFGAESGAGVVYAADDPSAGNLVFQASFYKTSMDSGSASACDGGGGGGVPAPDPLPSGASLVANGVTAAAALVQAGSDLWVADHALGFCRVVSGAIDQTSCVAGGAVAPGQSLFRSVPTVADPNAGFFYVPDMSSKSRGVYQYAYSGGQITAISVLAPNAGLGGNTPQAVAWGPDNKLYVVMKRNNAVVRVSPGAANAEAVGSVAGRAGPPALVFLGNTLYLAENTGLTQIANAAACGGNCRALAVQGAAVTAPLFVTADATALYLANFSAVYRFLPSQPGAGVANMSGGANGITALGVGTSNGDNTLFLGEDPTAGTQVARGRISRIARPPQ